jgi:hypothetical protein
VRSFSGGRQGVVITLHTTDEQEAQKRLLPLAMEMERQIQKAREVPLRGAVAMFLLFSTGLARVNLIIASPIVAIAWVVHRHRKE